MDSSSSQEQMMEMAKPTEQHKWLEKLVGDWTYEMEASMGADAPASVSTGQESFRSLGGIWFVGEGSCPGPDGAPAATMVTLGYNPAQQCYVGSWVGSMMSQLWVYKGQVSGNTLTLDTEGPKFDGTPSTARYQDIIEFKSDDHRVMRSRVQGPDGQWTEFMKADYRRK